MSPPSVLLSPVLLLRLTLNLPPSLFLRRSPSRQVEWLSSLLLSWCLCRQSRNRLLQPQYTAPVLPSGISLRGQPLRPLLLLYVWIKIAMFRDRLLGLSELYHSTDRTWAKMTLEEHGSREFVYTESVGYDVSHSPRRCVWVRFGASRSLTHKEKLICDLKLVIPFVFCRTC